MSFERESGHRRWAHQFSPSLALAGGILLIVAVLALLPRVLSDRERRLAQPVGKIVPASIDGWEVMPLDIAQSAEMQSQVIKVLRYDDMVYRSFRRGSLEIQVYVAYWSPGAVPYGQAGVHTPDTCWVHGGWQMEAKSNGCVLSFGKVGLKPAESRRFAQKGRTVHVLFWHLVGDRVHGYEQHGWKEGLVGLFERLPHIWGDVSRYGLNLEQEQIFVRISSNVDFAALQNDAAFVSLLAKLVPLGIGAL